MKKINKFVCILCHRILDKLEARQEVIEISELEAKSLDEKKLIGECIETIKRYDLLSLQTETESEKILLEDMSSNIIQSLIISGCKPIMDDKEYNMIRHIIFPFKMVPEGTPIQQILRPGIELNGRVLLQARILI